MQSFVVWNNEIEGRLDPLFYHPKYLQVIHKLQKSKYEIKRIGDICSRIVDGPFGTQLKVEEYTTEGIPVVRVSNVKTGEISENNLVKISPEKHIELKRSRVLPNDVLLTKAGAILGYSAVFPSYLKEGNITSHLVTITCAPEVNPHYLKTFFLSNVGQEQIYRWGNKSTRPELNTEEVRKILIPVPPSETQKQIIDIMQSAYEQKKQKEAEAQKLLVSIDGYVLDELGIKLPEVDDKMCFVVDSEEVRNNRVDAYYYQPKFEEIDKALNHVGYREFKGLLEIITKGETPLWRGDFYLSQGIPFLKVQNISQEGIKGELTYISEEVHNRMKRSQLNGGELLYTMAGTIGIATIFPEDFGVANVNQAIAKIVLKKDANKEFIKCVLNSNICKLQTQRFLTTSAQPNINFEQIKSLKIPFPPLDIQKKIAEEVKRRISEAERLKAEATKIIEEAKKQVEEMILGD